MTLIVCSIGTHDFVTVPCSVLDVRQTISKVRGGCGGEESERY